MNEISDNGVTQTNNNRIVHILNCNNKILVYEKYKHLFFLYREIISYCYHFWSILEIFKD